MIKALVIEDQDDHLNQLVAALNKYGCTARGARTEAQALSLCNSDRPHLIIYGDIRNSKSEPWFFALKVLNGKQPKDSGLYLARLAYPLSVRTLVMCQEFGFDEVAIKPLQLPVLLNWIKRAQERAKRTEGPS